MEPVSTYALGFDHFGNGIARCNIGVCRVKTGVKADKLGQIGDLFLQGDDWRKVVWVVKRCQGCALPNFC